MSLSSLTVKCVSLADTFNEARVKPGLTMSADSVLL